MKFRVLKYHLLCIVSMTFSRSLHASSGEIKTDRKLENTSTKSCLIKFHHKYIEKRTISRDEMQSKFENIIGTKHSK